MKTKLFILGMLCFFTANAQWQTVNSGTSEPLYDIYFVNDQTGYIAGGGDEYGWPEQNGHGVILKTMDGGQSWNVVFNQPEIGISNIVATNTSIYAYGRDQNGYISIISTNGGASWNTEAIPLNRIETKIKDNELYFIETTIGPPGILKKDDLSGTVVTLASNVYLYGMHQNQIAYINAAFDTVFRSDDMGQTWYALSGFPSSTLLTSNNALHAQIKAFNDTIVIRTTYGPDTYYSLDNGMTWNNHMGGPTKTTIVSDSIIYGVGTHSIGATNDMGQTWATQKYNTPNKLQNIYFYNKIFGFVVGDNGTIYRTINGGGLSINHSKLEKKIKIYPNPAKNILNLEIAGQISIQKVCITNMQGRLVEEYPGNTRQLDVSNLAPGNYFLQVFTKQGKTTKKIIVK